jgi:hypothetical protein
MHVRPYGWLHMCAVHELVPDVYAQYTHQIRTRIAQLRVRISS